MKKVSGLGRLIPRDKIIAQTPPDRNRVEILYKKSVGLIILPISFLSFALIGVVLDGGIVSTPLPVNVGVRILIISAILSIAATLIFASRFIDYGDYVRDEGLRSQLILLLSNNNVTEGFLSSQEAAECRSKINRWENVEKKKEYKAKKIEKDNYRHKLISEYEEKKKLEESEKEKVLFAINSEAGKI